MSLPELEACLARLYVDEAFRRLVELDPERSLEDYLLSEDERRAILGIDHARLEFFAVSLKEKRRRRLESTYPAAFSLEGSTASVFFNRYHALYPLRPNELSESEVRQFGEFFESSLAGATGVPPYAAELVRFERVVQEVRFRSRDVTAELPSLETTRTLSDNDVLTVQPGTQLERFDYPVIAIEEALIAGEDAPISPEDEIVIIVPSADEDRAKFLRVSEHTAALTELFDGRRTVYEVVSEIETRYGAIDLEAEVVAAAERLLDLGVLVRASAGVS
jgi:hypothetical protein